MSIDVLYPLSFDTASPSAGAAEYLHEPAVARLAKFFRTKGLAALKQEDREEQWYQDWIDYQADHRLYASVLSPAAYSTLGHQFDLLKLTRFLESFAYFSPAHAYSAHVTFLGLFPILMSSNEPLKREAIARLEGGGLFAFGVSERAHGSDLMANELTVRPVASGGWVADGAKSYIGNANAACMISVLAREGTAVPVPSRRAPFAFFVLRPGEAPAFQNLRKVRTLGIRAAFVGEFEVKSHPFPEGDFLLRGRGAWDTVLGTVDFGKFFLGFGAVGICAHAFAEAFAHLRNRALYGKPVTAMPHIAATVAFAYVRLVAMKLFAYRALDYLQVSSADDRRYLLFNSVQKARVSTEGVKVMALLSECIGARGFESETYFESALRETQLIPGLEGSTHINFGLTAQFLDAYFADPGKDALVPGSVSLGEAGHEESPYWMGPRDRNTRTVRFASFRDAYQPLQSLANVRSFVKQVEAFRQFARGGTAAVNPGANVGVAIALGQCLSVIVYAQLVAENCVAAMVALPTVSLIFHALIEDLSAEALMLAALFPPGSDQRSLLRRIVRSHRTPAADFEAVAESMAARYG